LKIYSFRSKLLIAVFALVLGSGLLISLLAHQRYSKSIVVSMIDRGNLLSKALSLEVADKILTNDIVALQKLLSAQQDSDPQMAYLFIEREGRVLAHTFSGGFPLELLAANSPTGENNGRHRRLVSRTGERYVDFAWPIFSGRAGVLRFGLSERPIQRQITNLWIQMALATGLILILAGAVSYWLIRRFTRPLLALSQAAEKIDAGNMNVSIPSAGKDEIGRVTGSFNRMVERFRRHTQNLEMKAEELDRAHRQMHSSFEIIQKVGAQPDLAGVCAYLHEKFCEIVPCSHFAFLIFGARRDKMFAYCGGRIHELASANLERGISEIEALEGRGFIANAHLPRDLVPDAYSSATRSAVFPIYRYEQWAGALLIGCPDHCHCGPQDLEVIQLILKQAAGVIHRAALHEEEIRDFRHRVEIEDNFSGMVGRDPKMQTIFKLIEDIAPTDASVLIQGESGTGKELVARAIHAHSLRRKKPFVVINCSAYPATLLESELFGHEKGAFTGAVRRKAGRFELADGGTVFLDEIGDISSTAQIKLLRVLQTRKLERLGGEETLAVDVRILSATNKNLLEEVQNERFREDLFYRLNVIPIQVPPLCDRRNDIPLLVRHFTRHFAVEQDRDVAEFSPEAMRLLLDYSWPGNVRELENSIEHAVVLARGSRIEVTDLPAAVCPPASLGRKRPLRKIDDSESDLLQEVLDECGWNKKEAARRLGISRSTLYNKIRKYRLVPSTIH